MRSFLAGSPAGTALVPQRQQAYAMVGNREYRRYLQQRGQGFETISGQARRGQQDGGQGINRTLGEQDGGARGGTAAQPETATVAAGTGSQALEGGAVGQRAGADQFGADGIGGAVAAGEDGIAAGVRVEGAGLAAALQQGGIEAAEAHQIVAHGRPVGRDRVGQAQRRGSRGGSDETGVAPSARKARAAWKPQPRACMTRSIAPPPRA